MSNKKNITEAPATVEKKKLDPTRLFLLIFASVALVGIIIGVIFACIPSSTKTLDYLNDNLSTYVNVPKSLYTNYKVNVDLPEISEDDIEYEIVKILCQNKKYHVNAEGKDILPINRPWGVKISAGDVVNIYYRGYTLAEDGVTKQYFDGGCNFAEELYALEIGSAKFIPGFEYNLIDEMNDDYATLTKINKEGDAVKANDIITLTYSVHYADGKTALSKTEMIDLSDPKLDEKYGVGFSEYFNNHDFVIGTSFATDADGDDKKLFVRTTTEAGGDDIYFDMSITQAYRISEGEVLEVAAHFPYNYGDETLDGQDAYFEVFIKSVQDYYVYDFDDTFITDVLKKTADDFKDFEGETLADKYRASIKSDLEKKYEEDVKSIVESTLWKSLIADSNFKKLPKADVERAYESYISEIESTYASGYSSYYSLDEFARAYLELGSGEDWRAKLRSDAEYSIKQKLAFYYIIRAEQLVPNDQEYQALYDELFGEYLQSYLDYYGYTENDENYEAKVEAGKKEILSQYGESYWRELVIYEFAIDALVERADITYANKN